MPFYEFLCECGVYFELGCEKKLNIDELFCVECASSKIKLLLYDEECHFRVHRLINDIQEISNRVEVLYDHLGLADDVRSISIEVEENSQDN